MTRRWPALACAALVALAVGASAAQDAAHTPPQEKPPDLSDLVNVLLGATMGTDVDGPALQKQVEEAGGVRFRRDVPVDFLNREQLVVYLKELFEDEYPREQARTDERLLRAFDLLPGGTDLRALRAKMLEENVAGFYDERPDRRRLYAVSEQRTFTPMNQIVLAHEMRHALQDQYADLHELMDDAVGDFDDRRLAVMALFEGDATLVMERFVRQRLGGLAEVAGLEGAAGAGLEAAGLGEAAAGEGAMAGLFDLPGAPPVVRDQLMQPYLAGLAFARALWSRGGPGALRDAWQRPPASTEQVLHPALFFSGERPRAVAPRLAAPAGARLLAQGVLGELLLRTLLEGGGVEAAAGWGGDGWQLWDVRGRILLSWRSEWDTAADAAEFHEALRLRFARYPVLSAEAGGWQRHGADDGRAFAIRRDGDAVELASADDATLLAGLLGPASSAPASSTNEAVPGEETLDFAGGAARVPSDPDAQKTSADAAPAAPGRGEPMATSTPPGDQTNLGMAPNVAGLLCYVPCCVGLVFSVVAAIVEKQSRFVRFHAFQSLLLHGAAIVVGIGLQILNAVLAMMSLGFIGLLLSIAGMLVGVALLVLTIYMMIKANANEEIELPVIGPLARNWV